METSQKPFLDWKIGIVGVGMVGEPLKRWFEMKGYVRGTNLFCYDTDPTKGYFDDVDRADIVFVAVPTPPNPDGSCNVSLVESVIGRLVGNKIVIIKSTVEPGTTERLQKRFPGHQILFNPEFLTESQVWSDFTHPDRQIIGFTDKSKGIAGELLQILPIAYWSSPSFFGAYKKNEMSATEAELAKYACNVFGALKVAYCNILADVGHAFRVLDPSFRIEYEHIRRMLAGDGRIGGAWTDVNYGDYCGFGGFCFPKDLQALIRRLEAIRADLNIRASSEDDELLIEVIDKGLGVLKAVWDYNEALLGWQGLTIEDVSKHDKEVVLQKRKPIRKTE